MVDLEKLQQQASRFEKKYVEREDKEHWGAWWSLGWRIALEWGSAVFASYLLGCGIDYVLGIEPWGLILFLLMGNVAGLFNIYRTYKKNENRTF
jgi:ATP synthase protein I